MLLTMFLVWAQIGRKGERKHDFGVSSPVLVTNGSDMSICMTVTLLYLSSEVLAGFSNFLPSAPGC